jgi:predicted secreted protein
MPVTTAIAIYFLIWWVVLFAILPFGIKSQHEHDGEMPPGTDPGAPVLPQIGRRVLWTTVVSAIIFAICYVVYVNHWVTLEGLANLLGMR